MSSDYCVDSFCSTTLNVTTQYCHVSVTASNGVGYSTTWYSSRGRVVTNVSVIFLSYLILNEDAAKLTPSNDVLLGLGVALLVITPRAHARARGYVIGRGVHILYIVWTFFGTNLLSPKKLTLRCLF